MKNATVTIKENSSGHVEFAKLIISVRTIYSNRCEVVVGYPGLPNVEKELRNGDSVLYETITDGTIDVRLTALNAAIQAEFLVTQVTPKIGFLAGGSTDDPNNSPFHETELQQISASIDLLKSQIHRDGILAADQFDLLSRKLDEIQGAAGRMGRKDWINYVAGSLTALCITAAFAPDVTKKIFFAANEAFTWLFAKNGIFLISGGGVP